MTYLAKDGTARKTSLMRGPALARGDRSKELAITLLARFDIAPGDALRFYSNGEVETLDDERKGIRLNHRVFKGRDGIHPGPRFLASIHEIDETRENALAEAVALHWSAPLAIAYRNTVIKRDCAGVPDASHFMVPSVVKALAQLNGWTTGVVSALGKPIDIEGKTGQLRARQRLETPNWFVHLTVNLFDLPVVEATHNSITLARGMPETLLDAMIGRKLKEIVEIPGFHASTSAENIVVRGRLGNTLQIDQAWEQAVSHTGADVRWADLARTAAFANDAGNDGVS